jgi:uncharacterized Zn-binding protein involved in type VI secretion
VHLHFPSQTCPPPPWVNPWGWGGALATHDPFLTFFSELPSYTPSPPAGCVSIPMMRYHLLWRSDLGVLRETPHTPPLLNPPMHGNAPNHACTSAMVCMQGRNHHLARLRPLVGLKPHFHGFGAKTFRGLFLHMLPHAQGGPKKACSSSHGCMHACRAGDDGLGVNGVMADFLGGPTRFHGGSALWHLGHMSAMPWVLLQGRQPHTALHMVSYKHPM